MEEPTAVEELEWLSEIVRKQYCARLGHSHQGRPECEGWRRAAAEVPR